MTDLKVVPKPEETENAESLQWKVNETVMTDIIGRLYEAKVIKEPQMKFIYDDRGILATLYNSHMNEEQISVLRQAQPDTFLMVMAVHAMGAGMMTIFTQKQKGKTLGHFTDEEVNDINGLFKAYDAYQLACENVDAKPGSDKKKYLDTVASQGVFLAKRTAGFSGADLENLLNEAALLAVRRNKDKISMAEIDEAQDRVLMGPAKVTHKYTEHEKEVVAYHEAGHAVVGIKLDGAHDVQKITIIPRGQAGGYNLMLPKEETYLSTKKELLETISGLLGGRVAEVLKFGEMTTGAHNDFEKATKIARAMVTEYGMSSLGPVQFEQQSEGSVFLGRDYNKSRNFSGQIAFQIDEEMRKIINDQYKVTENIIKENMDLLELIAKTLIEKETLTKEEIDSLVKNGSLPNDDVSFEDMTIAELKKYAEDNNISLNSTKKEDIIKELKDANK